MNELVMVIARAKAEAIAFRDPSFAYGGLGINSDL